MKNDQHRPTEMFHSLDHEDMTTADWLAITHRNIRSYRRMARRIFKMYPRPLGRVLDFGCGDGTLLHLLAEGWSPEASLMGVEINEELVRVAEERYGRGNVRFKHILDPLLDLGLGGYDLVISTFVCHHWNDPLEFFKVVRGLLKPGGNAYIEDIDPSSLYSALHSSILFRLIFRPLLKSFEGYRRSRLEAYPPVALRQALNSLDGITWIMKRRIGRVMMFINRTN